MKVDFVMYVRCCLTFMSLMLSDTSRWQDRPELAWVWPRYGDRTQHNLAWRPFQLTASQDMQMEMEHWLACIWQRKITMGVPCKVQWHNLCYKRYLQQGVWHLKKSHEQSCDGGMSARMHMHAKARFRRKGQSAHIHLLHHWSLFCTHLWVPLHKPVVLGNISQSRYFMPSPERANTIHHPPSRWV